MISGFLSGGTVPLRSRRSSRHVCVCVYFVSSCWRVMSALWVPVWSKVPGQGSFALSFPHSPEIQEQYSEEKERGNKSPNPTE